MKTIIFIAITLLAGAISGTILEAINQVAVEPYAAIISGAYLAMPANPDPINVQWIWSWALE